MAFKTDSSLNLLLQTSYLSMATLFWSPRLLQSSLPHSIPLPSPITLSSQDSKYYHCHATSKILIIYRTDYCIPYRLSRTSIMSEDSEDLTSDPCIFEHMMIRKYLEMYEFALWGNTFHRITSPDFLFLLTTKCTIKSGFTILSIIHTLMPLKMFLL